MVLPAKTDVYINNLVLRQLYKCQFVGVIIDSKLKWKLQITKMNTKTSKLIGVLYKI